METKEQIFIKEIRNLIRNTGRSNILFKSKIQEIIDKYDKTDAEDGGSDNKQAG